MLIMFFSFTLSAALSLILSHSYLPISMGKHYCLLYTLLLFAIMHMFAFAAVDGLQQIFNRIEIDIRSFWKASLWLSLIQSEVVLPVTYSYALSYHEQPLERLLSALHSRTRWWAGDILGAACYYIYFRRKQQRIALSDTAYALQLLKGVWIAGRVIGLGAVSFTLFLFKRVLTVARVVHLQRELESLSQAQRLHLGKLEEEYQRSQKIVQERLALNAPDAALTRRIMAQFLPEVVTIVSPLSIAANRDVAGMECYNTVLLEAMIAKLQKANCRYQIITHRIASIKERLLFFEKHKGGRFLLLYNGFWLSWALLSSLACVFLLTMQLRVIFAPTDNRFLWNIPTLLCVLAYSLSLALIGGSLFYGEAPPDFSSLRSPGLVAKFLTLID